MTDGIIQEIIKKFKKQSFGDCASETDVDELLIEIQQELIEKIKETITDNFKCSCVDTDDIKKALIGDNND